MSESTNAQELEVKNINYNNLSDEEYFQLMMDNSWTEEDQQELQDKESQSSFTKIERLRPSVKEKLTVRILPLRPEEQAMNQHPYAYSLSQIWLKIFIPDGKGGYVEDKNGKKISQSVPVTDARQTFTDLKKDLIVEYRKAAVKELKSRGVDQKIIDKVDGNSFSGGLKMDSKRICYAITDADWAAKKYNIQMLELSYGQQKDLETAKMNVWNNLKKYAEEDGVKGQIQCPLIGMSNGRFVEISGVEENKKIKYVFNISDNDRAIKPFNIEVNKALRAMPYIGSEIYRYNRYSLTATVEFLKQYDEMYGIGVFTSDEIQNLIKEIEGALPAADDKVFEFKDAKDAAKESGATAAMTIDELEIMYEAFVKSKADDKSEAGVEIKAKIKEFANDEELNVSILRTTTIKDAFQMVCDAIDGVTSETTDTKPAVGDEEEEDTYDEQEQYDEEEEEPVNAPAPTTASASTRRPTRRGINRG